jgi:hypothetical protein
VGQATGETLGSGQVFDAGEGVVDAVITDPMTVHFAGQPGMTVAIDLDRKGHPALDSHVHEAELAIEEV